MIRLTYDNRGTRRQPHRVMIVKDHLFDPIDEWWAACFAVRRWCATELGPPSVKGPWRNGPFNEFFFLDPNEAFHVKMRFAR